MKQCYEFCASCTSNCCVTDTTFNGVDRVAILSSDIGHLNPKTKDGKCEHFDSCDHCTKYSERPDICRLFPFYPVSKTEVVISIKCPYGLYVATALADPSSKIHEVAKEVVKSKLDSKYNATDYSLLRASCDYPLTVKWDSTK